MYQVDPSLSSHSTLFIANQNIGKNRRHSIRIDFSNQVRKMNFAIMTGFLSSVYIMTGFLSSSVYIMTGFLSSSVYIMTDFLSSSVYMTSSSLKKRIRNLMRCYSMFIPTLGKLKARISTTKVEPKSFRMLTFRYR